MVTGVQTCALPIWHAAKVLPPEQWSSEDIEFLAADANTTEEHVRSLAPGAAGGE